MLSSNRKTNLPKDALVFYPDGNLMCAVNGDFDNLQESPAGFGDGVLEALDSLRKDLIAEREEIDRRLGTIGRAMDGIYRSQGLSDIQIQINNSARRQMDTWPAWKRNTNWLDNRATNDVPRTPILSDDNGGY